MTDDLGAYAVGAASAVPLTFTGDPVLYYTNGVIGASPAAVAGPPLSISGISVPAGGNVLLIYRARVNDFASPVSGGSITNTVTISDGGLTSPVTAYETVSADTAALLSITKALSPEIVAENGRITYTFTIQNTGAAAADAGSSLTITDTFAPALKAPLTVTINGDTLEQSGNYSYNAASGEFATVAGRITVPAASFTQDAATGRYTVTPGITVVTVTGTI